MFSLILFPNFSIIVSVNEICGVESIKINKQNLIYRNIEIYIEIKNFKMRLSLKQREALRKRVKNLLPQIKKSQIVEHFFEEVTFK